jgi:hypothetical protein
VLGEAYIEKAVSVSLTLHLYRQGLLTNCFNAFSFQFKICHHIAPHIKLYINDYNIEEANAKSDALLALVERLLHKGTPIQGIGFQCHLNASDYPCVFRLLFQYGQSDRPLDDMQAIWSKIGRDLQI